MATVGTVTIDLNNLGDIINNSVDVGEQVTEGIADQGDLIGLAIGVSLALGLLIGLAISAILIVPILMGKIKGIRKGTKL